MAANLPKIVSFRFVSNDDGSKVVVEFGAKSIEKPIPQGHGVLRASAIFNDNVALIDMELVTEKV